MKALNIKGFHFHLQKEVYLKYFHIYFTLLMYFSINYWVWQNTCISLSSLILLR